ncbi:hypothetical protein RRF57_011220 [Xylaria bambusicola]|uniref:Uncharacterized protein n=1 Tax=Xylaria bambusicola TaxID=326684 RepID=A0AAN7UXS1_9PEZI
MSIPPNTLSLKSDPLFEVTVAVLKLPFAHWVSTIKPPRAVSPFKLPVGIALGRAGRMWMPAWLCNSISVIPLVKPKLPSIWKVAP